MSREPTQTEIMQEDEIYDLKAEIERLRAARKEDFGVICERNLEIEKLDDEIERLRAENDIVTKGYDEECNNTRDALTEIDRLRAALDFNKLKAWDVTADKNAEIERLRADVRSWEMAAGRTPLKGVIAEAAARSMRERAIHRLLSFGWTAAANLMDDLPLIEDTP